MRPIQIPAHVLEVLRDVDFDGQNARLAGQLDRATYLAVNKVLEALGGKWNRKLRAHAFADGDPRELIGDAVTTGGYVDAKQQMQFFPTPPQLAAELVRRAGVGAGMRVLEPSAGNGAIVRAILAAGCQSVAAVELDQRHGPALAGLLGAGAQGLVMGADFLTIVPDRVTAGGFDAIAMNPPFTRSQDIAHVRHAFTFLRPGGRLVAIMAIGWTFRQDRKAIEFREWLEARGGAWSENAPDAFRASGTLVRTVTVEVSA